MLSLLSLFSGSYGGQWPSSCVVTTLRALKFVLHIACMQCSDSGIGMYVNVGGGRRVYSCCLGSSTQCTKRCATGYAGPFVCWLQGPWVAPLVVLLLLLAAREHSA